MRRAAAAAAAFALAALFLTAGAAGGPDVPGDPTPPVVTPVIYGTLGANGWYTTNVTVNWSVVDPESVILSTSGCDATTLTTDTVGTKLTCTATSDGGETTVTKTIKLDKTAPTVTASPARAPDASGWYNHQLSVSFAGSDATSGVASCVAAQTYSGPDSAAAAVTGTCTDMAGNLGVASLGIRYDATAPVVTGSSAGRAPDANGWYNHAVSVAFAGSDATSGINHCSQPTYAGPDSGTASVSGTCVDNAGNVSADGAFGLKYDATGPTVTAAAGRAPDANGWYNHSVAVSFSGTDATSGLDSCDAAKTYAGPDDAAASVTGSCRDRAGNSTSKSLSLKYDATAPTMTATPGRSVDSNGWYNHPLTISFAGTDGVSGVDSCSGSQTYAGPDSGAASVIGTCVDKAGNLRTSAFPLKYDATAPQTSASPERGADANGWYDRPVSVSFAATDVTSGVDSCDPPHSYSGPDDPAATVAGSCRDKAGNTSSRSFALKYDATAPRVSATPDRAADASGWYDHSLSVSFSGSDGTSGVAGCAAAKPYAGPDAASASVAGTCSDVAGNVGTGSFAFKYDATAPQVTGATPGRPADANGWYNHPVAVGFTGSDGTSGVSSCATKTYSGPDSGLAAVTGTCVDTAGNVSAAGSYVLAYDATAPGVATSPARPPDSNGWYSRPITVSFEGADSTAGLSTCSAAQTYSGPDSGAASLAGTCSDKAGNVGVATFALKYDATPPSVNAVASRGADVNGWYNHPLDVSFNGNDGSSGIDACVGTVRYAGPDSASASVAGSCSDKAGNVGFASLPFQYDATGPRMTATADRAPDANGWYNHPLSVSYTGTDATSGLASCADPQRYAGPDDGSASVTGSCTDKAGNSSSRQLAVKYDATAPQVTGATPGRPADANGWYNHAVSVAFAGSDATSGIESCAEPSYAGPDDAAASVSGSCTDRAGNAATASAFSFKYDATPPKVATAVPVRPPDHDGWYNHPVAFAFEGTDLTSGVDSCAPTTYSGPDGADARVSGGCIDRAGNSGTASFPLAYDGTPPSATATADRVPDANGWYNHPLTVAVTGVDGTSGLASCTPPQRYSGPDSAKAAVTGVCADTAGNVSAAATFGLRYDATAPRVTGAVPSRSPDAGGWYNHPVAVAFQGTDETSQVDSCTTTTYGGPDAAKAAVSGSCRDRAGNQSGLLAYAVAYDATPPLRPLVHVRSGDRKVVLAWDVPADADRVEVTRWARRSTSAVRVYRGTGSSYTDSHLRNGVRYRYQVTVLDAAGNAATATVTAVPTASLFQPAAGARVSTPPLLAWKAVPHATYYNVQLWRGGKIFSAWPTATRLRLPRSWTYEGRRHRLTPGQYRWYVWPGFGARSGHRYGRLLGGSSFVVVSGGRG